MKILCTINESETNAIVKLSEFSNSIDELHLAFFQLRSDYDDDILFSQLSKDKNDVIRAIEEWWSLIFNKYNLFEYQGQHLKVDFQTSQIGFEGRLHCNH